MIVRDYPSVFRLFLVLNGSVLPRIYKHIIVLMLLTAGAVMYDTYVQELPHISLTVFSVLGVALSLFLGFRNDAAYNRWWQARMLWGELIAGVRASGHETRLFLEPDARREYLCMSGAFLHLHRAGLRNVADDYDSDALRWLDRETLDELKTHTNPAGAALTSLAMILEREAKEGRLSEFGKRTLTERIGLMELSRTSNEGIFNTPIPFVYSLLVWQTVILFCGLLPLGLLTSTGWLAPLVAGIAGYVFFGLAALTDELEHPFRASGNGLPLSALCRQADIALSVQLDREPPPPLEVRGHLLT